MLRREEEKGKKDKRMTNKSGEEIHYHNLGKLDGATTRCNRFYHENFSVWWINMGEQQTPSIGPSVAPLPYKFGMCDLKYINIFFV